MHDILLPGQLWGDDGKEIVAIQFATGLATCMAISSPFSLILSNAFEPFSIALLHILSCTK
jgi:hypothetical protein